MNDKLKLIASIFSLIGVVIGGFLFLDTRTHTIANSVVTPVKVQVFALDKRVKLNELKELLREAQEELLFWKRQLRKYPDDEEVKQEYDEAKERVNELKERIKELEKEDSQ